MLKYQNFLSGLGEEELKELITLDHTDLIRDNLEQRIDDSVDYSCKRTLRDPMASSMCRFIIQYDYETIYQNLKNPEFVSFVKRTLLSELDMKSQALEPILRRELLDLRDKGLYNRFRNLVMIGFPEAYSRSTPQDIEKWRSSNKAAGGRFEV